MGWFGKKKKPGEALPAGLGSGTPGKPGEAIGRYTIKKMIGKGGMGSVYLALDPLIGRQVAIKVISVRPDLAEEEAQQYRERFLREAQAAGALIHPNIVAVHDIGQDPATRQPYIVMEYMEGQDLKKVILSRAPLPAEEAVRIVLQIASALDYAHRRGIVHRDIKPANIMINERGQAKVTDFGVARLPGSDLTRSDQFVGSPGFMSPEQLKGAAVDGRSDLFALGVILYELLTGKAPFDGNSVSEVLYKISTQPAEPPSDIDADVSADFDPILEKSLHKEPAKRYQTGKEMIDALRAVPAGQGALAAPAKGGRTSGKKSRASGRAAVHRVSGIWNLSSGWRLGVFAVLMLVALVGVNWAIHKVFRGPIDAAPGRGRPATQAAAARAGSAPGRLSAAGTTPRAPALSARTPRPIRAQATPAPARKAVAAPAPAKKTATTPVPAKKAATAPAPSRKAASAPAPSSKTTAGTRTATTTTRTPATSPRTTSTARAVAARPPAKPAAARPAAPAPGKVKVELAHRLSSGRLVVLVDGKRVLSKPFTAPKGKTSGTVFHTLSVPSGRHGLEVRVLGAKGEVHAKSKITGTIARDRVSVLKAAQRPPAGKTLSLEWAASGTASRKTASR
jgi:serine/threonine-protein kinase